MLKVWLSVGRHSKDIGSLATVTLADLPGTPTSNGGRCCLFKQYECGLTDVSDRRDAMKHSLSLSLKNQQGLQLINPPSSKNIWVKNDPGEIVFFFFKLLTIRLIAVLALKIHIQISIKEMR